MERTLTQPDKKKSENYPEKVLLVFSKTYDKSRGAKDPIQTYRFQAPCII